MNTTELENIIFKNMENEKIYSVEDISELLDISHQKACYLLCKMRTDGKIERVKNDFRQYKIKTTSCPNCGSTTQMKVQKIEFIEDGWQIKVVRYYTCGCGETSMGVSYYRSNGEETIIPYSRHSLQQKLFGKG